MGFRDNIDAVERKRKKDVAEARNALARAVRKLGGLKSLRDECEAAVDDPDKVIICRRGLPIVATVVRVTKRDIVMEHKGAQLRGSLSKMHLHGSDGWHFQTIEHLDPKWTTDSADNAQGEDK